MSKWKIKKEEVNESTGGLHSFCKCYNHLTKLINKVRKKIQILRIQRRKYDPGTTGIKG